jgi:peptide/nickel transport system substrate-binding protein
MRFRPTVAVAVALAAAIVSVSAGCTSSPSGSPTAGTTAAVIPLLREGASTDFTNLNEENADNYISANWYDHLLKIGPNRQVEPWLAQSVTQQSPTVYVYHLRHGVKFWDGDEMTSDDVVNALNFYRTPSFYTANFYYTNVKSITAADKYTVIVTLKQPDTSWEYQLGLTGGIFEKKFQEEHKATMGNPGVGVMATGPYEVQSFDPTRGLELSANPRYWGGPVPVKHISVRFFATDVSMALAFRAGEIDLAYPQSAGQFAAPCGCHVISAPSNSSAGLAMNVRIAPWNNIHVRRAVAYAIDRPAEIKISGDNSTPTSTVFAPIELQSLGSQAQVDALINSLPSYPYNLTKAKQELAESPYPHGFTATTYTLEFGVYTPETEVVVAQLAKIGININVKELTFTGWDAKYAGPKTTGLWVVTGMTGLGPDPNSDAVGMLASRNAEALGGANLAAYSSPAVDTLIAQADSTQDKAQRLARYGQILKIVATDVPYVMFYTGSSDLALSPKFHWPGFNQYFYSSPWALQIRGCSGCGG